jgi:hypothetical protein
MPVTDIFYDLGGAVHNVKAYGAQANGTDDTPEIQAAINAANTAGGGIVFFPRGRYRIDGTLSVPTDVSLQGINTFRYSVGSVLEYRGSGTAINIAGDRVAIRGIRVEKYASTSGVIGIDTQGCKDLDFELVEVSGFLQKAFDADNSFRVIWRRCNIQGAATSGSIGIFSSVNFNANLVQSCGFIAVQGTAWHPIDINRNSSGVSSGSVISDNDFGGGLATDGSSGLDFFAIDLGAGCQAFHVHGNRVETVGMGFLRQINTAQGLTIVGNSIGGSDTASVARGIDIYGAGVEIGLNTWFQTTVAIYLNSTATRVTVAPQEVTNQVGTVLQNNSRNDLALRTYNDRTDAYTNLGTTGQGVRGGSFLPQRSVTHFSLVTPQGHSGTFSIYTALESNVTFRYKATGGGNCTVTQWTPGSFTIAIKGTTTTYTLAYATGVNTATLSASTSTTGTTLLVSHLIPLT